MRVCLNLIDKNQSVFSLLHFISGKHAYLKVKIFYGSDFRKEAVTEHIFNHIDFDEIFEKLLSDMADNICFADLPGTVNQ